MTNVNEVVTVDTNTGEIVETLPTTQVVSEDENYKVVKTADGKFIRKAKYKEFTSFEAQSRAEKIWLLNTMESDDETGNSLKDQKGKTLSISHIITRPYNKLDEDTGEKIEGVLTYLIETKEDGTHEAYVTSSKSVYFSINNILDVFGTPDTWEGEPIQLAVSTKRRENGDQVLVKMMG